MAWRSGYRCCEWRHSVEGTLQMNAAQANPRKPKALTKGSKIAVFAPASPADHQEILTGIA